MPLPAIAIFDIGKTNKKLFVFDEQYHIIYERSRTFDETADEDGYPCEDIHALTQWVKESINDILSNPDFSVRALNFSTYGASFVFIDQEGKPAAPLSNYLKPFPEAVEKQFYASYGDEMAFALQTASPPLGNLNSGLQLYRLKVEKPELFHQIRYCLHLPQYMSYLVTGRAYSDITSIGCHTGLWDFAGNHYHQWLYREQVIEKLAPLFPSNQGMPAQLNGNAVICGVGLHDSSAALIPYLSVFKEPFVLLSTGTWCISLNPFNQTRLTAEELKQDCLCYMEYRGRPVKASRLFAGYDHEQQVKALAAHFNVSQDFYKTIKPSASVKADFAVALSSVQQNRLSTKYAAETREKERNFSEFADYGQAYAQFMIDLVIQQVLSTNLVITNSPVKNIYVDGGFGSNPFYMELLTLAYPGIDIHAASVAQASAIGAALAIHQSWSKTPLPKQIISLKHYSPGMSAI